MISWRSGFSSCSLRCSRLHTVVGVACCQLLATLATTARGQGRSFFSARSLFSVLSDPAALATITACPRERKRMPENKSQNESGFQPFIYTDFSADKWKTLKMSSFNLGAGGHRNFVRPFSRRLPRRSIRATRTDFASCGFSPLVVRTLSASSADFVCRHRPSLPLVLPLM
jgi:hypothetical protein